MFGAAGSTGERATSALKVPETYTMGLDMANKRLTTMETSLEKVADEWGNVTRASEYYWKASEPDRGQANASRLADMMGGLGGGGGGMNPEGIVSGLSQEMDNFGKIASDVWDKFASGAKTALGYAISAVKTFASTLTGVLKSGLDKLTESVKNSTKGFTNLFNSIKRIAMYRALRTAIKIITSSLKEGMENLYRWSRLNDGEFSGSMDKLATEALHVKNALGAMLAPVINALTPIVEKLAHAFINVVNAINQFIAGVTGATSWTKALHTPVTYAQMAGSSFDKANKKAKELKNTILGFDEINRLNGKTDSDTSSELPYGSMFEKRPLDNFWKDWMKKLDWTDLGRLFAQRANKFLEQADNWILNVARPWAMKWSTRIATFLNGFVMDFNWELLGKTVADGLMTIIYSVNNFFDLFEAKKFGKGLARTVKGWFETIDWPAVGKYFTNKLNFIIDTASGFFGELAKDAGKYGKQIGEAFTSFVDNIHWNELSSALSSGLRSVADFLWNFIDQSRDSWKDLTGHLVGVINEFVSNPDTSRIIGAFTEFVNGIIRILPEIDWDGIGRRVGELIAGINWGEFIYNGLMASFEGINGIFHAVIEERVQNAMEKRKQWFSGTSADFKEMGAQITQSSLETGVNVSRNLKDMAKDTDDVFTKLSNTTYDFTGDVNKATVNFLTEASKGSTENMQKLSDDTVKLFGEVADAISKINTALSTSFSKMASSIADSMQRMYNSVSSNMTRIAKNVEDNARRIQNAFGSISGNNLSIKGYATGGFPEDGLFMANHGELVGGFANGKTAVANNAEITAGIEAAVYSAMTSALGNSNGGGDIVIRIDSEDIARASIKGQRHIDRRLNPTVKFTG